MANDPRNISTKTTAQRMAALINSYYAKKTDLPTKVSDLTNDSNFQTQSQVEAAIGSAIGAVYKPAGSIAFASLPALTEANLGKVYNITDAFTTTADFVEGAGKKYKAGADVGIIAIEDGGETVYKYNVFANFVDLGGYIEKVSPATAGNLSKLKADGSLEDAGVAADNVATKPASAVADHIAKFDANKNAVDSGIDIGDVQQKLASGSFTSGNIRTSDANGFAQDGGVAAADLQQKLASGNFTEGNIRTTNAQGFAQDGGIAADDILTVDDISDYTEAELRTLLGLPAAE